MVMEYGCCNCGETIELTKEHKICADCGGFCCNFSCLEDHECDEDGDM